MIANSRLARTLGAVALALAVALPASAANLVIFNGNAPGVGFNDPTPATPVGGNPGLTLGQQRINAFLYAASIWGAELNSTVNINILATMQPLTCSATSAVLGSAGATFIDWDFPGAPVPGHLYPIALANKILGFDEVPGQAHIRANFNSRLGEPTCLAGSPFYLGLDNNAGTAIDLVSVLLHEFGHGLGFASFTNGSTGVQAAGLPSIYDKFAYDTTINKAWNQMTDAQRQASALNSRKLVWTGQNVSTNASSVLKRGTPELNILTPWSLLGTYQVGVAAFGPAIDLHGVNKQIMQVVDQADGNTGLACTPLNAANARAVKNRIALVDRGVCGFTVKVKNAQDAGADAVIVVENVVTSPPADLGGVDPTITIPSVRVSLATGNAIKAAIRDTPGGRSSGVVGRIGLDPFQLAGADQWGRVMLFTPNPFQGGSSVSHWDTSASRNLLMEPFINADLAHSVKPPKDLTLPLLKDIGW
jgi:hypothetical protein